MTALLRYYMHFSGAGIQPGVIFSAMDSFGNFAYRFLVQKRRCPLLFLTFYRKKIIIPVLGAILSLVLISGSFLFFFVSHKKEPCFISGENRISARAASFGDLRRIAGELGLDISESSVKARRVFIPCKFNDIYQQYNDLQKLCGLDLEPYAGAECTLYSFPVKNRQGVCKWTLELLICNGLLIGGDLSENKLGGNMLSLGEIDERDK